MDSFGKIRWMLLCGCAAILCWGRGEASAQNGWPMQVQQGGPLDSLLRAEPDKFGEFLRDPDRYRIQVLYTRIDRDADNHPQLQHYGFRIDTAEYWNPASLVKLPTAAMALEKLNILEVPGLNRETRMEVEASFPCQDAVSLDENSPHGYPTIGNYIRKIFAVSDNEAFNRLYEFLGQRHLNGRLRSMGYPSARIISRLARCLPQENRYTNAVNFYGPDGRPVYRQNAQVNPEDLTVSLEEVRLGKKHENREGDIVPGPYDFKRKNFLSLWDLHRVLISLIMPESVPEKQRFRLRPEDYDFLRTAMSVLPKECGSPDYDPEKYFECYVKYLIYGREKESNIPNQVRIFNKVGLSYGFVSDVAYVVDYEHKVEFFLSAVVYVNDNETVNDGKYEYREKGWPFMRDLGQAVYRYELGRKRRYPPELLSYQWENFGKE